MVMVKFQSMQFQFQQAMNKSGMKVLGILVMLLRLDVVPKVAITTVGEVLANTSKMVSSSKTQRQLLLSQQDTHKNT